MLYADSSACSGITINKGVSIGKKTTDKSRAGLCIALWAVGGMQGWTFGVPQGGSIWPGLDHKTCPQHGNGLL